MGRVRVDAGGIGRLAAVLAERWDRVEADFQRFYALDLREQVADPRVGVRRLHALVDSLPPEASCWRTDDGGPAWTRADELAAVSLELTDVWGRMLHAALLRLGGARQLPDYKPFRVDHPNRPSSEPRQPKRVSIADAFGKLAPRP